MSILSPYVTNSYRRICDICGRPRQIERIRFSDGVAICDIHSQFRTAQQLNKINARIRPPKVLPVPQPKAFQPVDTYQAAESEIFRFITSSSGVSFDGNDVTANPGKQVARTTAEPTARAARYLAALVTEDRRPATWIAKATERLTAYADNIHAAIVGIGNNTHHTIANSFFYGAAFVVSGQPFRSEETAHCGLALLDAYRVLGAGKYLAAARACANFLRNAQAGHLLVSGFSSSDAAGTDRLYIGGWTSEYNGVPYYDHRYYVSSAVCLEFLTRLMSVVGDGLYGCTATIGAWVSAPSRLLSLSIADGAAFLSSGVRDASSGTTFSGLTADTPREVFNAYPASKYGGTLTGTGSWEYQDGNASTGTLLTTARLAQGIASLYAMEGSSARVTALYDYLMSFESNSAFEHADGTGKAVIQRGQTGEYDPTIAPATLLKVRTGSPLAATRVNGSSFYDWASAGLLAPIHSTRDRAGFKVAKDELALPRQRYAEGTPRDGETLYLGPLGISGLSFQPWTSATARIQSINRAAQVGMIYRYGQTAFTGQGH